jgi:hypothetical protein
MSLLYLEVLLTALVTGLGSAQSVKQKAAIEEEIKRLDVARAGDSCAEGQLSGVWWRGTPASSVKSR